MRCDVGVLNLLPPSIRACQVFQIPDEEADGSATEHGFQPLTFKSVPASDLLEGTVIARRELNATLVALFYERVWDPDCSDPSFFRDATVLLTPPFNTGNHLRALKLAASDAPALRASSKASAPTTGEDVEAKLKGAWDEIRRRAVVACRKQQQQAEAEAEAGADGASAAKRPRLSLSKSASPLPRNFDKYAFFGHGCGEDDGGDGVKGEPGAPQDIVDIAVREETKRYQALIMGTSEVCLLFFLVRIGEGAVEWNVEVGWDYFLWPSC